MSSAGGDASIAPATELLVVDRMPLSLVPVLGRGSPGAKEGDAAAARILPAML